MKTKRVESPQFDSGGNLYFSATLLTKNKKPNRAGAILSWDTVEDVSTSNFEKNPVVLYQHQEGSLPVGYGSIEVRDNDVILDAVIPNLSKDENSAGFDKEVLSTLRGAIHNGLLRAVSAGFYPVKENFRDDGVRIIKKIDFVEASIVTIGAHEDATIKQNVSDIPDVFKNNTTEEQENRENSEFLTFSANIMTHSPVPAVTKSANIDHDCVLYYSDNTKKLCHRHTPADIKETLAKVLGARGGIKVNDDVRKDCYNHIAQEYAEIVEHSVPELKDYSTDELQELHNSGKIIIPGMCPPDTLDVDEDAKEEQISTPVEKDYTPANYDIFMDKLMTLTMDKISDELDDRVKAMLDKELQDRRHNM